MEQLKKEGLTRLIGPSQHHAQDLKELEKGWSVVPAVNQVSLKFSCKFRSACLPLE